MTDTNINYTIGTISKNKIDVIIIMQTFNLMYKVISHVQKVNQQCRVTRQFSKTPQTWMLLMPRVSLLWLRRGQGRRWSGQVRSRR